MSARGVGCEELRNYDHLVTATVAESLARDGIDKGESVYRTFDRRGNSGESFLQQRGRVLGSLALWIEHCRAVRPDVPLQEIGCATCPVIDMVNTMYDLGAEAMLHHGLDYQTLNSAIETARRAVADEQLAS